MSKKTPSQIFDSELDIQKIQQEKQSLIQEANDIIQKIGKLTEYKLTHSNQIDNLYIDLEKNTEKYQQLITKKKKLESHGGNKINKRKRRKTKSNKLSKKKIFEKNLFMISYVYMCS